MPKARRRTPCIRCDAPILPGQEYEWARNGPDAGRGFFHSRCSGSPIPPSPVPARPDHPVPVPTPVTGGNGAEALINAITGEVMGRVNASFAGRFTQIEDLIRSGEAFESRVLDIVTDLIGPRPIEVRVPGQPPKAVGLVHRNFEELMYQVSQGKNLYLRGPAGSFKTSTAKKVAEALSKPFHLQAFGLQSSKSDVFGFVTANGEYIRTPLREAYEHGGLYIADELDGANVGIHTLLNDVLEEDCRNFPDGRVAKHPDFLFIGTGNTALVGGDSKYVGRQRGDGALISRVTSMLWDYDEAMERSVALDLNPKASPFVSWFHNLRREAAVSVPDLLVTPRALFRLSRDLANGRKNIEQMLDMEIWKGAVSESNRTMLMNKVGVFPTVDMSCVAA